MYIVHKGGGVGRFDDLDPCDDIAIKTQIYSNIFKTMKGEYGAKNLHSRILAQAPPPNINENVLSNFCWGWGYSQFEHS